MNEVVPRVIAWELTRRCPLRCRHCRGAACDTAYEEELTTEEGRRLLEACTAFGRPLILFTGGEPCTRPDLLLLLRHAKVLGLPTALATCGRGLTSEFCAHLLDAGVRRISVSLDGPDAYHHDEFRGVPGAFAATLRGLECARRAGLPFQMNTTVTHTNVVRLPQMLDLACSLHAVALDLFFFVPVGRGERALQERLTPLDYQAAFAWANGVLSAEAFPLRLTCAPYAAAFAATGSAATTPCASDTARETSQRLTSGWRGRIVDDTAIKNSIARVGADGDGRGPQLQRGCLAGRSFLFISHQGVLQPCGFLEESCGGLRDADFQLADLWQKSSVLQALREPSRLGAGCGACRWNNACGGCRARALAEKGNFLAGDPDCPLERGGDAW